MYNGVFLVVWVFSSNFALLKTIYLLTFKEL
jgi:hypothetical protein